MHNRYRFQRDGGASVEFGDIVYVRTADADAHGCAPERDDQHSNLGKRGGLKVAGFEASSRVLCFLASFPRSDIYGFVDGAGEQGKKEALAASGSRPSDLSDSIWGLVRWWIYFTVRFFDRNRVQQASDSRGPVFCYRCRCTRPGFGADWLCADISNRASHRHRTVKGRAQGAERIHLQQCGAQKYGPTVI